MRYKISKFIGTVLLMGFLSLAVAGYLFNAWLNKPLIVTEPVQIYVVKPGAGLIQVARDLANKSILTFPRLFDVYARVIQQSNIKAGEYSIEMSDTPRTLLDKFHRGEVLTYFVVLIEGKTFADALEQIHAQQKLISTLASTEMLTQFLDSLKLEGNHPEGWFFPDTYQYVAGETDQDVLRRAHQRMEDILATEWANRAGDLPYKSAYEALIMASIVERETGLESERQKIAGVFVRRLERKMRLQTDPTVIYGLGDTYTGNLRRKHLSQVTPYNTYTMFGLPPTPIALPGKEAIFAALHPDDSESLYFVARGDGSHYFSSSLEEHNQAVKQYQIQGRVQNYRSSPQKTP